MQAFRGTTIEQDGRFSNKQKKLLKNTKFPIEYDELSVDIKKVNLNILNEWISKRITELLGIEDEIIVNMVINILEEAKQGKALNPKELQINLTGFMAKNAYIFVKELWQMLSDASMNEIGVPKSLIEEKKREIQNAREANRNVTNKVATVNGLSVPSKSKVRSRSRSHERRHHKRHRRHRSRSRSKDRDRHRRKTSRSRSRSKDRDRHRRKTSRSRSRSKDRDRHRRKTSRSRSRSKDRDRHRRKTSRSRSRSRDRDGHRRKTSRSRSRSRNRDGHRRKRSKDHHRRSHKKKKRRRSKSNE